MFVNMNFPYLLAVHTLCVDGQLHVNELQFIKALGKNIGINDETLEAAELILTQSDDHLPLDTVLNGISPDQRMRALSLSALASRYDGVVDVTEQNLLDRLRSQWQVDDVAYAQLQDLAHKEAQRLIAELKNSSTGEISTGAKVLNNLESLLGKSLIDRVIGTFGTSSMKERIQDYRIEALLSGHQYDDAIKECRSVGLNDIEIADACLEATATSLKEISSALDSKIDEIANQIGDKPAQAAREALRSMKEDRNEIDRLISQEILKLQELQIKKRRAMNFYTIAFMGRSKAGKSTLHAVVTGGGWDQIGVGRQNTTRLNRVYEWNNIRIIDTPGIATPGGEELEKVANSIIDEADLVCFVATDNNQQSSEFEFLKSLRSKGKPLLMLLNVKEDLSHPVRLKRFLEKPDQAFSEEKDRLGGHIDRIRRDAAEHYGTSNFKIIPVQLLAAQIAQQQPDHIHADSLMKASRLKYFLDSVRLSLLDEGLLRRSQNLLGSTVADIERPSQDLKNRSQFYTSFAQQIHNRSKESNLRLNKAQADHACQLKTDLLSVFAALRHEVPDFAEYHWDDSESSLNEAWLGELERFGMESRIQQVQAKVLDAFAEDMKDLFIEISQEIDLHRNLSFSSKKLSEQDSSVWVGKTLQWGSGLAGLGVAVAALANWWNPAGWVWGAIAIVGLIASLFESKASKRRKAVSKITSSLESQIDKQEKQIVEAALKHFNEQCTVSAAAIQDYFRLSTNCLSYVGRMLNGGVQHLELQIDTLNSHFAARILDFTNDSPSEASARKLRESIVKVERKVGESICISVSKELCESKELTRLESIIQEKITIQKVEV